MRDGTFRNAVEDANLDIKGETAALAAGDVNKDGYTDFFFARADGPGTWALSDARGQYKLSAGSAVTTGASAAQLVDYDNDGLLDLVLFVNGNLENRA
ncbi:MAG: VCBS repeat-containing protein [Pyrinomonadaceae bacterium]